MSSFYSRNKRDHSDELAKLEQKRYEDLLSQERNKRKNIISSVKTSIEGSRLKDNFPKENISHLEDIALEETKVVKEDQKIISPVCQNPIESSKEKEQKGFSLKTSEPRLPKLKNAPKIPSKVKKMQETELKKLNKELNALEEEEAEIESSLQKIDLQAYKRKVVASLQTISEDTREMEESLGKTNFGPIASKNQTEMGNEEPISSTNLDKMANVIQIPVINDFQQDRTHINRLEKEKKKANDNKKPADVGNGKRIVYSNLSAPQTPESLNLIIKSPRRITTQSVHSENVRKENKAYSSNHVKASRVKKTKFLSRDFVRVNPNIDIKNLLLS